VNGVASALEVAIQSEPRLRHLQSIVVLLDDEILVERYFRDRRAEDLSNLHSVTKSVLSSLVGIAIGDGSLELSTTVGDLLGSRIAATDAAKAAITVEQLLTMTSGLAADGPHDIDEIADVGGSWVEGPLAAPLRSPPGTKFDYNNGAAHLLGVMVAAATGQPLSRLAEERLFAPIGIGSYRWPRDPEGNSLGYGHLELRPRDIARLGELYLGQGHVGGVRVVDPAYIDAATTAATPGGPPENVAYGYLWWITRCAGKPAYFAGGYGGQYVTVVPALGLVVATTGDVDVFIASSANAWRLVEDVVIAML
jgi:CubicO group peptidase (beta-lactamase class C family)